MKKRILIVSPSFLPEGSGAAQYYSELLQHQPEDITVDLLTTRSAKKAKVSKGRIYAILPSLVRSFVLLRLLILPLTTFFAICYLRLRGRIDVLQVHSSTAITLGAMKASLILRIPITYDVQDMQAPRWLLRMGYKPHYVSVGDIVTQQLLDRGITREKICEIFSIVPSSIPANLPEAIPTRFVFVGSLLRKAKGLETLISAMRTVGSTNTDCSLHIIGDGKDRKWLQKTIRTDLWLASHIRLLGELPHEAVLREIAQARVLVLPSASEAVPRVIIEAFALGRPVISTRVGSVPSLLGNNERGILMPVGDVDALVQAMHSILRDKDQVDAMSKAAHEYAKKLPSWTKLGPEILSFSLRL